MQSLLACLPRPSGLLSAYTCVLCLSLYCQCAVPPLVSCVSSCSHLLSFAACMWLTFSSSVTHTSSASLSLLLTLSACLLPSPSLSCSLSLYLPWLSPFSAFSSFSPWHLPHFPACLCFSFSATFLFIRVHLSFLHPLVGLPVSPSPHPSVSPCLSSSPPSFSLPLSPSVSTPWLRVCLFLFLSVLPVSLSQSAVSLLPHTFSTSVLSLPARLPTPDQLLVKCTSPESVPSDSCGHCSATLVRLEEVASLVYTINEPLIEYWHLLNGNFLFFSQENW